MQNRYAMVYIPTGLVDNIIIWEGAEWAPPKNYLVVQTNEGQIGDYWHEKTHAFYTINNKRRSLDKLGKCYEAALDDTESKLISSTLDKVFSPVRQRIEEAKLALEKQES